MTTAGSTGLGKSIAELSLASDFAGVLLWGHINNRPYLRCLYGYALCLWRLGRGAEAEQVFRRMFWLNPNDNQGAGMLIDDVQRGIPWCASECRV